MTPPWPPESGVPDHPDFARLAPMPFPVSVPFRVRADLARLRIGTDRASLPVWSDAAYRDYARLKRKHLDDPHRPLVRLARGADPARVIDALARAMRLIAGWQPEVIAPGASADEFRMVRAGLSLLARDRCPVRALHPSAQPLAQALRALDPARRCLAALSLGLQEDLALMGWVEGEGAAAAAEAAQVTPGPGRARGADGAAAALGGSGGERAGLLALGLSVVFPSGWDPADKLGRALWAIHRPVAQGEALREASQNLSRAMVDKGPFERHVWTITADASLARWPGAPAVPATIPESADLGDLYFRCERQVTLGLPEARASLFLIRVLVAPLVQVAADAERRARLVAALCSMSDEVLAYKQLHRLRDRIRAAWGDIDET